MSKQNLAKLYLFLDPQNNYLCHSYTAFKFHLLGIELILLNLPNPLTNIFGLYDIFLYDRVAEFCLKMMHNIISGCSSSRSLDYPKK